ncbi:MAG: hypothetical protein KGI28_01585 [Thaumarchaeota archaeon]|nr:hypothetical protein [Nitrososphaerota archaeon]
MTIIVRKPGSGVDTLSRTEPDIIIDQNELQKLADSKDLSRVFGKQYDKREDREN